MLARVVALVNTVGLITPPFWKGTLVKKRILVLLSVVALMVVMLAMAVGPAVATQPTQWNPPQHDPQHPGYPGSRNSHNCVAYSSAQVIHNGAVVRTQTPRGGLVKGQQASCNDANQK
jgi:hypothetical protein